MITALCRTQSQVSDLSNYRQLLVAGGCCDCPCQFTPPINAFTYCVLKKICKKILKEICQEQRREVFTVFDGGPYSKYESLMKDQNQQLKNERCTNRLEVKKEKTYITRASAESHVKRKQLLDPSEALARKNDKEESNKTRHKGKQKDPGKDQIKEAKHTEQKDENDTEKHVGDEKQIKEKRNGKDKKKDSNDNERRSSKLEKTNVSGITSNRPKLEPERPKKQQLIERQASEGKPSKPTKEAAKTSPESIRSPIDKRNRANRRGSQDECRKLKLSSLITNRLDIDRDFSRRHCATSCAVGDGQCEQIEQICICQNPCKTRCTLSRIDSIKPCDYMRANMEYKEMCCQRVLPPCEPWVTRETCYVPKQNSQTPAAPCYSYPISYVQCGV